MKAYIIKKIVILLLLLFGITFITFALTKALPGDPVYSMVGERANPETIEKIRKEIGTDRSLIRQYAGYLALLLKGEMGRSYYTNREVITEIRSKFINTFRLAMFAMIIASTLGIMAGLIAAIKKGSSTDRIISAFSIAGLSIPVFWIGLLLMIFFSLKLKLLPPSGTGDIRYLILPAVTLSMPALASITRVMRVTTIDILNMPFVRTAEAKGLNRIKIYLIHILRNALLPVVTVIGLEFGSYLNGAVLTETIFNWDGIGRFTMEGIIKRDYPVIMGCILTGTAVFVIINIAVDIIYHYIDPRVRVHGIDR